MRNRILQPLLWLFAAYLFGFLSDKGGVPASWMLGPMLAAMLMRFFLPAHESFRITGLFWGQLLIGCTLGAQFSLEAVKGGLVHAPPLLVLILFMTALSLGNAFLLKKLTGIDPATAFLGALPGAASSVVALASEMDVDRLAVTVLMYVRVIMIILFIPVMVSLMPSEAMGAGAVLSQVKVAEISLYSFVLTFVFGFAGIFFGRLLNLPTPNYLGPFLLILALRTLFPGIPMGLPGSFFNAGLLFLGLSVGMQLDIRDLKLVYKPAIVQSILVICLMLACFAGGYLFHLLSGVDLLTAVLGTTPGGKNTIVAMSMTLEANTEMILVMQTLRWLMVMLLGPVLAVRLGKINKGK